MPGGAELARAGDGVVHRVQAGGVEVVAEVVHHLVEAGEEFGGRELQIGERVHSGPQLPHGGRLGQTVSHHIADDQRHPGAGQRDHVVPVAADLDALVGGQITDGGTDRAQRRKLARQKSPLELLGPHVLGVEQPGALDGLRHQSAECDEQSPFLSAETPRISEGDDAAADAAAGGDQRQEGPGCLLGLGRAVGHPGVALDVLLRRVDEGGRSPAVHLVERSDVADLSSVDVPEEPLRVSDLPGDAQRLPFDEVDDETGGAERRHDPLGGGVHDVLHRQGLGKGTGQGGDAGVAVGRDAFRRDGLGLP